MQFTTTGFGGHVDDGHDSDDCGSGNSDEQLSKRVIYHYISSVAICGLYLG